MSESESPFPGGESLSAQPRTRSLSAEDAKRLDEFFNFLKDKTKRMIGYPTNLSFDIHGIERFLEFSINNVGDPYIDGTYKLNSHEFERDVIDFFAKLYRLDKAESWGYVTHGGTEGNMYGLFLARELLPDGIAYYSDDRHYSVEKILRLLRIRHICVRSQEKGEMDYNDLRSSLKEHRDQPAIIIANIGTTMKGAVDDIKQIRGALSDNAIHEFYIHCDAALSGMILPFIKLAPKFDFPSGADSIAVSGHKFIGMPVPSGVVIARRSNVERVKNKVEYIGSNDTTISGSRNGISTLMLWRTIRALGREGFEEQVTRVRALTYLTYISLQQLGWPTEMNDYSTTVFIKRPSDLIIEKWQLAVYGDTAHIIIMPHVTSTMISELVDDLRMEVEPD